MVWNEPLKTLEEHSLSSRCRPNFHIAWFLLAITTPIWVAAETAATQAATIDYGAQATHSAHPHAPIVVHGQSNLLIAASAALQQCNTQYPQTGYCEITRLAGQTLTPANSIRARIPDTRHPLYLWHYESPTATVYLAGSVHVLKKGLYPLPAQLEQAFALSDNLVLEVDTSRYTPQQMQALLMQYGLLENGKTLGQVLDPDLYTRLSAVAAQYGFPLAQLDMLKPALVTQQLGVATFTTIGYDPAMGVEQYFTGRAAGKTIREIESMEFQLDLLLNQPMDAQIQMVNDTLDQRGELDPLMADLVAAWFSGDDESFQAAFDEQAAASELSAEFLRQLMDQRNVGMASKIEGYLAAGGSYMVLVGSAHFIGDKGIVALLTDRGIKGQRIFSDDQL